MDRTEILDIIRELVDDFEDDSVIDWAYSAIETLETILNEDV